jgi:hypothetical protein
MNNCILLLIRENFIFSFNFNFFNKFPYFRLKYIIKLLKKSKKNENNQNFYFLILFTYISY